MFDSPLFDRVHSSSLPGSFAVVEGLVLGSTKTVIGYMFTSDE